MNKSFNFPSPPSPVLKRKSSQTGIDYDYFPKDQYYNNRHLVAMPILRGRKQFYNNMRNELTGINKRAQMVKPLKSNNSNTFFTMMKKSTKQQKTLSPKFKLTDYCSLKNKGYCNLYTHSFRTNEYETNKLFLNPSSNNIRNYVKYLLKVRKDTKKALGKKNQDLLVDLFLHKLNLNNEIVFLSVIDDELFIDSNFIHQMNGGRRRNRKRKRKYSRKKRNVF
jgi:hypothetical protein